MISTTRATDAMSSVYDSAAFRVAIDAVNDIAEHAYLCGGTVRDMMNGRSPNDIDIAATVGDFDRLVHGYKSRLIFQGGSAVKIAKDYVHTLTSGAAKGSRLYRVKIEINVENVVHCLDMDFRELKFEGYQTMSIGDLLQKDVMTRDFRVNGLYCSTRDKIVVDLVRGIKDFENKLLSTINDAKITFKDERRMIRAVRLSIVHGYQLNSDIKEYIRSTGRKDIEESPQKRLISLEYAKVLSEVDKYADIISTLSKHGLILNSKPCPVHPQDIRNAYAVLANNIDLNDRLDQVFEKCANSRQALAVTCVIIKSSLEDRAKTSSIEFKDPFGNIFRNMVTSSQQFKSSNPEKSELYIQLQKFFHIEAMLGHPKMTRFLEVVGWHNDGNSSLVNQGQLEICYKKIIGAKSSMPVKSQSLPKSKWDGLIDQPEGVNSQRIKENDPVLDDDMKITCLFGKARSVQLSDHSPVDQMNFFRRTASMNDQPLSTIQNSSELEFMRKCRERQIDELQSLEHDLACSSDKSKSELRINHNSSFKKQREAHQVVSETFKSTEINDKPIPLKSSNLSSPIKTINNIDASNHQETVNILKASDLIAEPWKVTGLEPIQTLRMLKALSIYGELVIPGSFSESECVQVIVDLIQNKPALSIMTTEILVAEYCVKNSLKLDTERSNIRNHTEAFIEFMSSRQS